MKKKPTKLTDLSQLSSVISFSTEPNEEKRGRFVIDGTRAKWVDDEKGSWRMINLPKKDEN